MKYYKLKYFYNIDLKEAYHGFTVKFIPPLEVEKFTFTTSLLDLNVNQKATFILDKSITSFNFDIVSSSDGIVIGSVDFCNILAEYEKNFTFIEIFGFFHNGKPIAKKYKIIHIGYSLDALDYFNSSYNGKMINLERIKKNQDPLLIKTILKLIIDNNKVNNKHFFFLKNTTIRNPIISNELKIAFDQKGLKLEYEEL